jgi:hypothetical protein
MNEAKGVQNNNALIIKQASTLMNMNDYDTHNMLDNCVSLARLLLDT